ncbi:MAG: DUF2474 family protein [Rhizobiales bacterium]|nr:DUF2474 family protein [Hyphomicrobiales bacterium]
MEGLPLTSGVKRLLWFAALWAAGVIAVGAVAYLLRLVLQA